MARWYDKNSREHRIDEFKQYAEIAAKYLNNGDSILEIAPGPGCLSIELGKAGSYKITGLVISNDFVKISLENAIRAGMVIDMNRNVTDKDIDAYLKNPEI